MELAVVLPNESKPAAPIDKTRRHELCTRLMWCAHWAQPSDETRNRLVEYYQGLVRDSVRRFSGRLPRSIDRGDLATAANVGLMNAIGSFDPRRGVRFESYSEMRIRGALLDELRAQDWLPRPWRQRIEFQKRTLERLRSELNAEPRDEDVARVMDMPMSDYQRTFGVVLPGTPPGSMPSSDSDDELNHGLEVVPDTRADAPGERLSQEELLRLVAQRLTEQEYRIVYLRYWEELPMREIGQLTKLSESRVCKIHARLLERLKDRFRAHVGEA